MHTLLSVQEAFAAKNAGKNVVCRHAESEFFEDLKNVSAETWFDPHYIFALQIETIVIAGYEITKPYAIDELTIGQDIFFIGASGTILKGQFNPENEMLVAAVHNGSVQRDEENAIKQIKAVRSLLGVEGDTTKITDYDFFVVDGESPKPETKKRGGRKKKESTATVPSSNEEVINSAQSIEELNEIKATFNEANVELYEMIGKKEDSLNAESTISVPVEDEQIAKENSSAIVQDYITQLNACMTDDEVMQVRYTLSADNRLEREQVLHLNECGEKRMASIDSEEIDHTDPAVSKYIDAISAAGSNAELVQIEDNIIDDDHKFLHDDLNLFRELITQKRQVFKKIKAETQLAAFKDNLNDASTVEDLNELAIKVESLGDIHPDLEEDFYILSVDIAAKLEKLNQINFIDQEQQHDNDPKGVVNTFTIQINEAKNIADLKKVELEINKYWSLDETDRLDLKHRLKFRREELEMQSGSIPELKELQKDAMNLSQYESQLSDLINHVQNAQTVDEANEPASKTLGWSDAQRLPLLTAISKRLVELDVTLLTQIRTAPSIAILNCLLSEVKALGTGTYAHNCMEAYRERRYALTQASPA